MATTCSPPWRPVMGTEARIVLVAALSNRTSELVFVTPKSSSASAGHAAISPSPSSHGVSRTLAPPRRRRPSLRRVVVEALAALPAELAGHDHALEERGRGEARLPELVEHDLGHEERRVQPDEV